MAAGRPALAGVDPAPAPGRHPEPDPGTPPGDELGGQAEAAAACAGRRIRAATEQVARPVDQLAGLVLAGVGRAAPALNPLRITGRAISAVTSAAVHVAVVVSRRSRPPDRRSAAVDHGAV